MNRRRHRRLDGRRLGRLRQRRLSRICSSTSTAVRSCFTTTAAAASRRSASGRGLPRWVNANSAVWLDYDRDGWLDLFLAGYWPEDVDLWKLTTTRIMPESFEYAENGGRKYLLRNRGDGTFDDVTAAAGHHVAALDARRSAPPTCWAPAIPICFSPTTTASRSCYANRGRRSRVRRCRPRDRCRPHAQERDERVVRRRLQRRPPVDLQDEHLGAGCAGAGQRSLGAEAGAGGGAVEYENLASSLGVDLGGWSWGAQFGDLNNDGTLDIYLVNGYVSAGRSHQLLVRLLRDRRRAQRHHRRRAELARDERPQPVRLPAKARLDQRRPWAASPRWRRSSARPTSTTAAPSRWPTCRTPACSTCIVANQRGPLLLYKNSVQPGRHWIAFELEGSASNRSAIGARVELHWNGRRQVQEVSGGSGFSAQNQRRLHYGLGERGAGGPRRDPLAVGPSPDDGTARGRHAPQGDGTSMSPDTTAVSPAARAACPAASVLTLDNRFLGPILITCILIAAHLSFGILEGYERTGAGDRRRRFWRRWRWAA